MSEEVAGAGLAPGWREALDEHCARFLGACRTVEHELVSEAVHVDLYSHPPAGGRPWLTLRTGGVSVSATRAPEGMAAYRYVELLTYLPGSWDLTRADTRWPGRMLTHIGRHVHREETWLGPGHTLTLGDGKAPYAGGTHFTGAVLVPPNCETEAFDRLEIEGLPVRFLWVVPLTAAEIDYKLAHGSDGLLDLMRKRRVGQALDPRRPCLVTGERPLP